MAQLSDDCFAFGGPMMSVDEAVGIITSRVRAVGEVEAVPLVDADGRILARDIAAPLPLPPFTNSAVDGYAVPSGELPHDRERAFPVKGRVQAGVSAPAAMPGVAVRIFTGAPMPEGTDTVFTSASSLTAFANVENYQFTGTGNRVELEVIGKNAVAHQISDECEHRGCDHGRYDRQAIESVGQIDRI